MAIGVCFGSSWFIGRLVFQHFDCNESLLSLHFQKLQNLTSFTEMSLNRCEQRVLDYTNSHPDERQYWMDKVRGTLASNPDPHEAARLLDSDLWYYYHERAQVVEPFKSAARTEGLQRTSMKNLAEYWLRIWTPQRTKNKRVRTYDEM